MKSITFTALLAIGLYILLMSGGSTLAADAPEPPVSDSQNRLCGDVDNNGLVDLQDLVGVLAFITDRSNAADSALCDVDGCEGVTVNDATYLASYMYNQGPDLICETVPCQPNTGIELTAGEVHFSFDKVLDTGYVEFTVNVTNTTGFPVRGAAIGLAVSSPTGVTARGLSPIKENTIWESSYTHVLTDEYGDTAGLVSTLFQPTYSGGETGVAARVRIKTGALEMGETICIDSCTFPPAGQWVWSLSNPESYLYTASWDGPWCFTVPDWCCSVFRGNIDNDPADAIDISDLVHLTDYMFAGGPAPGCFEEADLDESGLEPIDVTDLILLVEFMFDSGPQPPDCPIGTGTVFQP